METIHADPNRTAERIAGREERRERNKKVQSFIVRVGTYIVLAALFWGPFYYLVKSQGISENAALIAAGIGVIPLLFLFVPAFQRLLDRISGLKVGAFELKFPEAIEKSVVGSAAERITLAADWERHTLSSKHGLREFANIVWEYLPLLHKKRLVISVDLATEKKIGVDELYFQAMHLDALFDLRAFLFIDNRQHSTESYILGTLSPDKALSAIEKYIGPKSREVFREATEAPPLLANRGLLEDYIFKTWNIFHDHVAGKWADLGEDKLKLTDGVYANIFADHLEANIIPYPLGEPSYSTLLEYLELSHDHLILVQPGGNEGRARLINVRTIDRVAREIAKNVVEAAIEQRSTEEG